MKTAKATYNVPRGDSKVVEMGGMTFFDGQEVELNSDEHGHLMSKLPNNQHFTFVAGEDLPDAKPKRGRPSNAEKAAADAGKAAEAQATAAAPAAAVLPTVQPVL
ncbi:hypothetical protein [Bradyrhizobium oligotrophicum]|uniref:hypothetical protein n=1 Tax=Bradyrhizobium oligotrophicum TaxID=44255 RepID=UPI003EB78F74